MNKLQKIVVVAVLMMSVATPSSAAINLQPKPVTLPSEYVTPLSEQAFQTLKSQFPCTALNVPKCSTNIQEHAVNKYITTKHVYLRPEHNGEMYQIVYPLRQDKYNLRLVRYLPDGIYKNKKKVYVVSHGVRFQVKKNTAQNAVSRMAQVGYTFGMEQSTIDLLIDKNTVCTLEHENVTEQEECMTHADELRDEYGARFLLSTANGELYFLPYNGLPVALSDYSDEELYTLLQSVANVQSRSTLQHLQKGKALFQ